MIPVDVHDPDCACHLCEAERAESHRSFFDYDQVEEDDGEPQ